MNRQWARGIISTVMVVLAMGTVAEAVVVYSEDFNGLSGINSIADFGWTLGGGVKLATLPAGTGQWPENFDPVGGYVDGSYAPDASWIGGSASRSVGYHNTGVWTYSADIRFRAPTGGGMSIGLWNSTFPAGNGHYIQANNAPNGAVFSPYTWGLGEGVYMPGVFLPAQEAFHAEIVMDFDNFRMKGEMTQIDTPSFVVSTGWLPIPLGPGDNLNNHFGFDTIRIYQANTFGGNGSIQVDNVALSNNEVAPAPASLILLLAGLLGLVGTWFRRDRRDN